MNLSSEITYRNATCIVRFIRKRVASSCGQGSETHVSHTSRLTRLVTSDYISRTLSDIALVLDAPMSEMPLEI